MGNITVYFKQLGYLGDRTYCQKFIVWTDDRGNQVILRGGEKAAIDGVSGPGGGSGASGIDKPGAGVDFPFRSLVAALPPANFKASNDHPLPGVVDPSQVIITGSDNQLKPYWNKMVSESEKINKEDIGYAFGGQNSNTYVTTVLQFAGFPAVKDNGLNSATPAPGADMPLMDGRYSAARGYSELRENALARGGATSNMEF